VKITLNAMHPLTMIITVRIVQILDLQKTRY